MSFPGTVPVTAAANEEGVCVPVGWVPVYRYESEDVAAGVPEPYRRIAHARLRVPWGTGWRDVVTDGGLLGSQDPGLVGDYYYQFVRLLELCWYARLGLIGAGAGYGHTLEGGEPLVQSWTCVVAEGGSGTSVGLSTAPPVGKSDPRRLPLWGGTAYTCLQPGDVLLLNGVEAVVCSLPDLSSPLGVATVTLHKPLYAQAGDGVTVQRQQPTAWFAMPVYRAKWVEALRTDWLPWSGGPIELKRSSGAAGALAWPYRDDDPESGYRGNFRAWGRKPDGTIEEVTSTLLEGFPGLGEEPRLSIYTDEGGETHTYVTPFEMEHTLFQFRYVMEVVSQNYPTGATQWRGAQSCCKWVCRDWSNMIARGGETGTKADMLGRHWFCEKRSQLGSSFYAVRFHEWCMQTECPYFAQRTPWRLSVAAMARVAMGRNLHLKGETGSEVVARAQGPSLFEMAGMPGYTGNGTKLTPVVWYGKNTPEATEGLFGVLEDVPVAERQADEGAVKRLRYGAIKGVGSGVLAQGGTYRKADRAGGKSYQEPGQYEDGSDYYGEEAYQPLREMPSSAMDETAFAALPEGKVEAEVQRVRTNKIRIPGIVKGEDATINGVAVAWEKDGEELTGKLTLTIPPLWGVTFGAKTLSAAAATVERAATIDSGNALLLEFLPEEVTCDGIDNNGNAVTYRWLSAGGTVCAKNEQRLFNPKAKTQNRYGSMSAKVCRGDSIRFTDLTGYENELVTVIWAKAHAGAVYSGAGSSTPPNGASVPAIYQTQAWRLAQDVVYVDLPPGRLRTYLDAVGPGVLAGKKIEVANKSVMPPLRSVRVEGAQAFFQDTGYTVRLMHFEQSAAPREEMLNPLDVSFDPANGVITIEASATAGWASAAKHHLAVLHGATGSGCYLFHRGQGLCAEHLTHLRTALRSLQWFEADDVVIGSWNNAVSAYVPASSLNQDGQFQTVLCTNGEWRNVYLSGLIHKTWPQVATGSNMAPYGATGAIQGIGVSVPIPPGVSPSLFDSYDVAWDKLYFREGGSDFGVGCPIQSSDPTGQWLAWRNFKWCNQVIELDPSHFGRFRREWIGQALVDVRCPDAAVDHYATTWTWNAETASMDQNVVHDAATLRVHLVAYIASEVTIPGLEEPGWTFEAAGFSAFTLMDGNLWQTVDVTNLVRGLCAKPYPSGKKLVLVLQAGNGVDLTSEVGARDLARGCYGAELHFNAYDAETNPYGWELGDSENDGHVGRLNSGFQDLYYLSYTGFEARRMRIKLDWDAMEAEDYLPHRMLMVSGGNMPAMA